MGSHRWNLGCRFDLEHPLLLALHLSWGQDKGEEKCLRTDGHDGTKNASLDDFSV